MATMRQRRRTMTSTVNQQFVASHEDWNNPSDWQIAIMEIALIRGPVSISMLQRRLLIGYTRAVKLQKMLCVAAIISPDPPHMSMVKRIVSDGYIEYWICQPIDYARFVQAIDDECYGLARAYSRLLGRVVR